MTNRPTAAGTSRACDGRL